MKKISILFFAILATLSYAQVTFNPGIRAGLNLAKFTQSDSGVYNWFDNNDTNMNFQQGSPGPQMSFMPAFYIGFQGNIRFTKVYALQPEVNFSMQGSNVEIMEKKYEPRVNYLSFQLVNKFYFNQFNMHIGPSIDVSMGSKNFKMNNTTDLGILFGLGYDINKNFGIEARIKKGMIPVTNSGSEDNTNVLIQTGLTFTFPNGKE